MRVTRPLLAGAAAALACLLPVAATASDTPSKALASIVAAASAQASVHYTSTTDFGAEQVSFVGDAGLVDGSQTITYTKSGKTGHVTVIVSGGAAYIRGDAFTLKNYIGFAAAPATDYAGKWVRFPKTDKGYATLAAGVTLPSVVSELGLGGRLTSVPTTTIGAQQVFGVRGTDAPAKGVATVNTVYARAVGTRLPVEEVATHGSIKLTMSFSNWNETIAIPAPNGSVAISVVRNDKKGSGGGFVD
jgi:hypothetical protein